MHNLVDTISMIAFNCRSINDNKKIVKELLNKNDIIFLSETWCNNLRLFIETLGIDTNQYKIFHNSEREKDPPDLN